MAKRKQSAGKAATPRSAAKGKTGAPQAVAVAADPQIASEGGVAAPSTQTPKPNAATISRKEMLRESARRKRRQQNMWLAVAGAVIVALIGVAVYISYRNSLPVVGETTYATQGNLHIPLGSVANITYNSTPPTSGPHYENLASWGVHTSNVRYEHLIHNLEDAGVVVYYQCDDGCPDIVAELESILQPYLVEGRHVVLARNDPNWVENGIQLHKDMGARIALVAWRKLLLMDEVDAETIRTFIDRYEGIDHHRG
jgi:hypothetical protein